jgi:hypothetical protein
MIHPHPALPICLFRSGAPYGRDHVPRASGRHRSSPVPHPRSPSLPLRPASRGGARYGPGYRTSFRGTRKAHPTRAFRVRTLGTPPRRSGRHRRVRDRRSGRLGRSGRRGRARDEPLPLRGLGETGGRVTGLARGTPRWTPNEPYCHQSRESR